MSKGGLAVAVVIVVIIIAVGAFFLMNVQHNSIESGDNPSDWTQWYGNDTEPGVSDALTPITESQMKEVWKVESTVDPSSTNWRTPGTPICIGDCTYYYDGGEQKLKCVRTSDGKPIAEAECRSDSVYNMSLAYRDGKIFVPRCIDGKTTVQAFEASTMNPLFTTEGVSGGQIQGPVTYHDGRVFFGTYSGYFACFSTIDEDASSSTEVKSPEWILEEGGWYNASPAFADRYCIIADKGFSSGGSKNYTTIYSIDYTSGAVVSAVHLSSDFCFSGLNYYEPNGRVYVATVSDGGKSTDGNVTDGRLVIRSYKISADGILDESSSKIWESNVYGGGTQSFPVIYNDRLYIGGGGSTLITNEPIHVFDINRDGSLTEAYSVDIKTKGALMLSTGYASEKNGYSVYLYFMEYETPGKIYVLRDRAGQTSADIVMTIGTSTPQYSYQSFSISQDGYVLIRNDSTLFCFGTGSVYDAAAVSDSISLLKSMYESGCASTLDAERIEYRYSQLSSSQKSAVANYGDLQRMYVKLTLTYDGKTVTEKVVAGDVPDLPVVKNNSGYIQTGWAGASDWNPVSGKIASDTVLNMKTARSYEISFDTAGAGSVKSIYAKTGGQIGYLPDVSRDGYTFIGWYSGNKQYNTSDSFPGSSDLILTAKWLKDYTVTIDSKGGSSAASITVTEGLPVGELPVVKKAGYTFAGWYCGDKLYISTTVYTEGKDALFEARWTENPSVTVSSRGVDVTAKMDASATASVTMRKSLNVVGTTGAKGVDFMQISLKGEGIDGSQDFEVKLPGLKGSENAFYYIYSSEDGGFVGYLAESFTSDGKTVLKVHGKTSSSGADIIIGVPSSMNISELLE